MMTKQKRVVELFLASRRPTTRRTYQSAWDMWVINLKVRAVSEPTAIDAAEWLAGLRAKGASPATLKLKYHALRSLYEAILSAGASKINPFERVAKFLNLRDTRQVRPTEMIAFNQVQYLCERPDADTPQGKRDRAILSVMFGLGLRRSEVQRLNLNDVMTRDGEIVFLKLKDTKAGGDAFQPVPSWVAETLSVYVIQRARDGAENSDPLFVDYWYKKRINLRISDSAVYRIFKLWTGKHPHAARATFCTRLLDQGFDISAVASAMRHADLQQIQVYDKRHSILERNVGKLVDFAENAKKILKGSRS